jgi:predicted helicase
MPAVGIFYQLHDATKAIYENFYKVYNPKAADRLGVVYTPNEIVRFMVESADWLCEKHFGKNLIDRNVEILDPATGTGTFVVELLEHFRGRPAALKYKYLNELNANEVAILPYYVANLNIEATYAAITDEYTEFPNLCFVDTLDNTTALKLSHAVTGDLFGAVSEENVVRIRRQNTKKISVIIGNPPYNANQQNENDNNKNREYLEIDRRIKATYIRESTAQKTKLYDMYARFFRWASDRIEDDGIVAFVSNRSFIDNRNFDGFRKQVATEFSDIYILDLGGDVRDNPKLSGTMHNVFGIQTGVAISFLVKRRKASGCRIHYGRRPEFETRDEKLAFLHDASIERAAADAIRPDAKHNWLRLTSNDFDDFLPLATKETKASKLVAQERAIFKLFSLGESTNRDEWLYDIDPDSLAKKVRHLIRAYDAVPASAEEFPETLKWSRNLKRRLNAGRREKFKPNLIRPVLYRPFARRFQYDSPLFVDERGSADAMFPERDPNITIDILVGGRQEFSAIASSILTNLNLYSADAAVLLPKYRYADGQPVDNITDWALRQFSSNYSDTGITKDDIFAYIYAVLHDPVYRETYALNLKRDFPHIPYYPAFRRWREWGQTLIDLHTGYEAVEPFPLVRSDVPDAKVRATGQSPRPILKAERENGIIVLDTETQLSGIPREAWNYKLGNRSALDWVLDQHKQKTPSPTSRIGCARMRF